MNWSAVRSATVTTLVCLTVFSLNPFIKSANGQIILGPEDTAIAIDVDGQISVSNHPATEDAPKLIDQDPLNNAMPPVPTRTKYLNFGGRESGFIVTPALGLPVESFTLRLANDASGRDPATWQLFGRNGTLTSTDNSTGLLETWTMIDMGSTGLDPVAAMNPRSSLLAPIDVNLAAVAGAGFDRYKMIFPTLRDPNNAIFQVGEVQFFDGNNATGNAILAPGDPIIAVNPRTAPNSRYPAAETPIRGIDHIHTTKYLNFGEERSGLIITNLQGPVDVNFMRLTTANDFPERDPTSYELYGTNQPITSVEHSTGLGAEAWTLISSGPLSLPLARFDASTIVAVNSPVNYQSYKLIFPTTRNPGATDSMQIADIQFATTLSQIPEPSTIVFVLFGLLATAVRRHKW